MVIVSPLIVVLESIDAADRIVARADDPKRNEPSNAVPAG
jgi:hypothetical protein